MKSSNENIIKSWISPLRESGWNRVEDTQFFAKLVGEKMFFSAIPDVGSGIIPIHAEGDEELHRYLSQFSSNIYVGDLDNTWNLPEYRAMPIAYQVIPARPKIQKEARSQVRQSERSGVTLGELKDYNVLVRETAKRQNRAGVNAWVLGEMLDSFNGIGAYKDGELIAGCLYADYGEELHLVHSASHEDAWNLRPNHLIYNELIKRADGREIYLGNSPANLIGLKKFKESFGAETRIFNIKYYEA